MKTKYILFACVLLVSACLNRELDRTIAEFYHIDVDVNENVVLTTHRGTMVIDKEIKYIQNDENFIIVMQIPVEEIIQKISSKGGLKEDIDRAIRESDERHYWIIDLTKNHKYTDKSKEEIDSLIANENVYGPLSYEKYDSFRNALNVPCELQFERRQKMKESAIYFNF